MTNSLTKQWREGTLPLGTYYILNINGVEEIDKSIAIGELWNNTDLKEVLAPVPSYDEYKKLKEQLEIAKKALDCYKTDVLGESYISRLAINTLKEMEGVNDNDEKR